MIKNNDTDVQPWTVQDIVGALSDKPTKKQKIIIPKYQRSLVWKFEQKQLFIRSVQAGFPIGSLLLFNTGAADGNTVYSLTDGLQRASTLLDYSRNPTKYFETDSIPEEIVKQIIELARIEDSKIEEVKSTIVAWIKSLKGFEEKDDFSSRELSDEIDDKLDLRLKKAANKELGKILQPFTESVKKQADIFDFKIPVVIYSGEESNLPTIFERLNKQGTQLTKYQIYAATWANDTLKIKNRKIVEAIAKKYQKLISEGLEIEQFNPDIEAFAKENFSVFEYLFGLSKVLVDKYPSLFGDEREEEGIGFNIAAVCLDISIKTMNGKNENLPKKFLKIDKDIGQNQFEIALFDSIEVVNSYLQPFIALKANKKSTNKKSTIYHTEFQIVSMIGKVFKSKYDDKDYKSIKPDWRKIDASLGRNIPYYYLYDLIKGYWRNSGDSKTSLVSNSSHYERPIAKWEWEIAFKEWFKIEFEKQEKLRANISDISVLFMKYTYTHLLTAHEELSKKEFEIEHIIPVDKLKKIVGAGAGIPISAVSNLCLIEKNLNRAKGASTFYEYADAKKGTTDKINLLELEKYTFTKRKDIDFAYDKEVILEDYEKFLKDRFEKIKKQFFDLNKITE